MQLLINFFTFQIGWFACVLGGAYGLPWVGTGIALVIVAWHLTRAARPGQELLLVFIAAMIGLMFDSLLVTLGWLAYPSGTLIDGAAPHWIVALWMLFATTLNVSLSWLKQNLPIAIVFGAIGGPLAYWGGAKLGALTLLSPAPGLIALAIGWAVFTPILVILARRFDGFVNHLDITKEVKDA